MLCGTATPFFVCVNKHLPTPISRISYTQVLAGVQVLRRQTFSELELDPVVIINPVSGSKMCNVTRNCYCFNQIQSAFADTLKMLEEASLETNFNNLNYEIANTLKCQNLQ